MRVKTLLLDLTMLMMNWSIATSSVASRLNGPRYGINGKSDLKTNRPVIGILTQPLNHKPDDRNLEANAYIMASYIKFVQQGGAEVVPIFHTDSDEKILSTMNKINGVLFPGGSTELITDDGELTDFSKKGKLILDSAKLFNDRGENFPLYMICMGFEQLSVMEAPYKDTLAKHAFNANDNSDSLTFISDPSSSKLYKNMPEHLLEGLKLEDLTYNSHHDGVYPQIYQKYPALREYNVLAVSYDDDGKEYVANVESKKYPIYGFQYHPEKSQFIWKDGLKINHSELAIELAIYYSRFFAQQAKMNGHHFTDKEELMRTKIENFPISIFKKSAIQDSYVFNLP